MRPRTSINYQFLSLPTRINRAHLGIGMCVQNFSFSSAVDEPWYKSGLKFKCTQCGDCCSGKEGSVRFDDDEGKAIANRLHISFEEFLENYSRLNRFGQREFKEVQVGLQAACCWAAMGRCWIYFTDIVISFHYRSQNMVWIVSFWIEVLNQAKHCARCMVYALCNAAHGHSGAATSNNLKHGKLQVKIVLE